MTPALLSVLPEIDHVLVELDGAPPVTAALSVDEALAERLAHRSSGPILRLWECDRALVVPKRCLRDRESVVDSQGRTWPLYARGSGGSAVAHGPGILNMSLILRREAPFTPSLETAYRAWSELLVSALGVGYGIDAEIGVVEGAFCAGAFDVGVSGRKLAGVAQVRRARSVIVHGTILVDVDTSAYLELVALADQVDRYDTDRIVSLNELTSEPMSCEELASAIIAVVQPVDVERS